MINPLALIYEHDNRQTAKVFLFLIRNQNTQDGFPPERLLEKKQCEPSPFEQTAGLAFSGAKTSSFELG